MSKSVLIGSDVDVRIADQLFRLSIVESRGDPEAGRISFGSPIGSALLGREEGDRVKVKTPSNRILQTEILKVY